MERWGEKEKEGWRDGEMERLSSPPSVSPSLPLPLSLSMGYFLNQGLIVEVVGWEGWIQIDR